MESTLDQGNGRQCVLTELRIVQQPRTGTKIAYVPESDFDEWILSKLPPVRAELYAESVATGNPHPRALATRFEENIAGVTLPPRSVIIRRPEKLDTLEKRIRLGQALRHELTHTAGGNEIEACLAHRTYLQKQGLQGPSDQQLLKAIASGGYSFAEFRSALAKIEGQTPKFLHLVYKWLEARYAGSKYWVKEDLEATLQNNSINRTAGRRLS